MLLLYHLDMTREVPQLGGVHIIAPAMQNVSLSQLPASIVVVSSALEHTDVSLNI